MFNFSLSSQPNLVHPQEDELRTKPKHEHLLEELHVLIEVEGAPGVAEARFQAAAAEIKHICLPVVSHLYYLSLD